MKTVLNLIVFSAILTVLAGCSGSGNSLVTPDTKDADILNLPISDPIDNTESAQDIPRADYSLIAGGDINENPDGLLFAGTLELDAESGTITSTVDRGPMINWNVTGYLLSGGCAGGCFRYTINSIVDEVWDIDVTIENPVAIQAYDVRLIFTELGNKTIENLDGYSDLFDPPDAPYINPFIAFVKEYIMRPFPYGPGGTDTQKVMLKWPTGDPPVIKYIVTASLPENTEEPYTIYDFVQIDELYWDQGECNIGVSVKDWQWDITAILADTTIFNNEILMLVNSPESPEKFEVQLINENNVYPGIYPTLFKAESPNSQNASMYNIYDIVVTGPDQNAPVCDFYVDPDQITTGQTTWLHPGPGISDPDFNDIVFYEFDFFYNDGIFDVMASNTTGDPVESPPAPYLGPNPVDITMALRITDNGVPPMSSICIDIVTISSNEAPVCELVLSEYEINSGASVDCWPGAGTNDPDGSIVMYEYDFDYDGITFDVDESNSTGDPVASGPIDNTTMDPVLITIALRVTDNGTPPATHICSAELTVNPIMTALNPWRDPAVRVTPYNVEWASIDRNNMENNLCVYGEDVYVIYHGSINGVEDFWIQRSNDGGIVFGLPKRFNCEMNCTSFPNNEFVSMDILANGWVGVATFAYHDNCSPSSDESEVRFWTVKPSSGNSVELASYLVLQRKQGRFAVSAGEGIYSVDVAAHPTDPDVCFVDAIDLDGGITGDGPDDTSLWKITNITQTAQATIEFAVVEPVTNAPFESGVDKAHMDAVCDYNGNLHVVWCSRDLGTIYYSMVYGNSTFPFDHTEYVQVNQFGEEYPEGAHVDIDNNNVAYITYAATGIPGEIEPQEIGMLTGVGYPPTFPDPPFILNHDRIGDQVYPDIEFDQTTGDLWVAYTTFINGPGQITFELYDAIDGWTQFEPDYWINKDDDTNSHNDENVHLFLSSDTGTAYAIWEESDGPNSPHIYFNRTN